MASAITAVITMMEMRLRPRLLWWELWLPGRTVGAALTVGTGMGTVVGSGVAALSGAVGGYCACLVSVKLNDLMKKGVLE